jgi:DNA-binding Xre family transcriptional regulator
MLDKRKDGISHAKITMADAIHIRSSVNGSRELAKEFGISISSVQKIRQGRNWK